MSIEEQRQLMEGWFNGEYFIEIAPEDYDMFINYISIYDLRFKDYAGTICEKIYIAWRFSDTIHNYQLEFAYDKNYWKGKLLKFNKVRGYIGKYFNLQII